MRRLRVVVGLVLLFGAGCAEPAAPAAGSSASGAASAAEVAWMTEFCTVVGDLRTGLWGSGGSGGGAGLGESLDAQLSAAADALGKARDELGSLPAGSPDGGVVAVRELAGRLGALRDSVVDGRQELAALPADATEEELGAVLAEVWPEVASRAGSPLDGVAVTDDMKAAADGPVCRAVPGLR